MRLLDRAQEVYREQGLRSAAVMAAKKVLSPAMQIGSLHFLEGDLRRGLPKVPPIPGIITREAYVSDVRLLDGPDETAHTFSDAVERLRNGHRWFIAIEHATGKLANYRWVSTTTALIPEIECDLVVGPGQAYVYDIVTLREFRRRGIDSLNRHSVYDYLYKSCGITTVLEYIQYENRASLRAARQFENRVGRVWYMCIRGGTVRFSVKSSKNLPEFRPLQTPSESWDAGTSRRSGPHKVS